MVLEVFWHRLKFLVESSKLATQIKLENPLMCISAQYHHSGPLDRETIQFCLKNSIQLI